MNQENVITSQFSRFISFSKSIIFNFKRWLENSALSGSHGSGIVLKLKELIKEHKIRDVIDISKDFITHVHESILLVDAVILQLYQLHKVRLKDETERSVC